MGLIGPRERDATARTGRRLHSAALDELFDGLCAEYARGPGLGLAPARFDHRVAHLSSEGRALEVLHLLREVLSRLVREVRRHSFHVLEGPLPQDLRDVAPRS